MIRRTMAVGIAAAGAFGLGGCGTVVIDNGKVESGIRKLLEAHGVKANTITSLSCPSGQQPKAGAAYNCKITISGQKGTVSGIQVNAKGEIRIEKVSQGG
jgi:hypothetical protein